MLKVHHTSKDSKPNIEDEEKERLTIMPEADSSHKTKINIIHQNTDLLLDTQIARSLLK